MLVWFAYFLCSLGAMNWGLEKFFDFNLVEYLNKMIKIDYFKEVLYGVISLAGLYVFLGLFIG